MTERAVDGLGSQQNASAGAAPTLWRSISDPLLTCDHEAGPRAFAHEAALELAQAAIAYAMP